MKERKKKLLIVTLYPVSTRSTVSNGTILIAFIAFNGWSIVLELKPGKIASLCCSVYISVMFRQCLIKCYLPVPAFESPLWHVVTSCVIFTYPLSLRTFKDGLWAHTSVLLAFLRNSVQLIDLFHFQTNTVRLYGDIYCFHMCRCLLFRLFGGGQCTANVSEELFASFFKAEDFDGVILCLMGTEL
jgi:hypothetical protein